MTRNALQRLAIMRVAMGAYAVVWTAARAANILDTARQPARRFDPVGPLWFMDQPVPVWVVVVGIVVVVVSGIAFTIGWRYRAAAPLAAVSFLLLTTYRNSWGHIIHTENLVAMQLLILAVAPAGIVWSLDRRNGTGPAIGAASSDDGWWAVKSMSVLAVGTYFVAGVAKLRIGGLDWIDGDVLLHQVAFDNARKIQIGSPASPFAAWFVSQQWLMLPAAIGAMVIELGAPLALVKERVAVIWAAMSVLLHLGILAVMAILFPFQLLGFGVLPLIPVEIGVARVLRRRQRLGSFSRWTRRSPTISTT